MRMTDKDKKIISAIAARLKQLRLNKGLSRFKLASLTGVTPMDIYRHESGRTLPSKKALEKYRKVLVGI